jgi:hypothetical protein
MWSAETWRRAALFGGLGLLLGACGFSPLYEAHDQLVDPVLATVAVDQINDHLGVVLTNHLRDGFNPGGDGGAAYQLHVDLSEESIGIAYRTDGTIAQTQVNLTANWTLRRISDRKIVGTGSSLGTTFYDDMPDAYANTTAKQSGEMRAVDSLADDIHARIALLLKDAAPAS